MREPVAAPFAGGAFIPPRRLPRLAAQEVFLGKEIDAGQEADGKMSVTVAPIVKASGGSKLNPTINVPAASATKTESRARVKNANRAHGIVVASL